MGQPLPRDGSSWPFSHSAWGRCRPRGDKHTALLLIFSSGSRDNYGFVTYRYAEEAFAAIESGHKLRRPDEQPFDLCFGGRRQFCRRNYADLGESRSPQFGGWHRGSSPSQRCSGPHPWGRSGLAGQGHVQSCPKGRLDRGSPSLRRCDGGQVRTSISPALGVEVGT